MLFLRHVNDFHITITTTAVLIRERDCPNQMWSESIQLH